SALVCAYLRRFPIERGKYRLMKLATSWFLIVKLEPGLFSRIRGLSHVEASIIRNGLFEPETVRVFTALLSPGLTVLDVGANVGQSALLAAGRVGEAGTVHAFEPTPDVAAGLRRNVELNGFGNTVVNQLAVSDTAGEATLYFLEPGDPGENTIVAGAPGLQ